MSAARKEEARPRHPTRSLRRSLAALLFLYAVAFAAAVLAGIKCQGAAPWRAGGSKEPLSPQDGGR